MEKLARNKARDEAVRCALEAAGWRVIVIWECEIGHSGRVTAAVDELRAAPRLIQLSR
jgi:DNA mismatch endonuclease (patch repair protein)